MKSITYEKASKTDFYSSTQALCMMFLANKESDFTSLFDAYSELESIIQYRFHDKTILIQAFTHPSFYWESRNSSDSHREEDREYCIGGARKRSLPQCHFQRLEFLGDAILNLVVSVFLFEENPKATDGQMSICRSKIVNNTTLSKVSFRLDFPRFLRHSNPMLDIIGPSLTKVAADLFESVIGAIFMDASQRAHSESEKEFSDSHNSRESIALEYCSQFVKSHLLRQIPQESIDPKKVVLDPKSFYQHLVESSSKKEEASKNRPIYKVLTKQWTSNGPLYEIGLSLQSSERKSSEKSDDDFSVVAIGKAATVKEAQRKAAMNALRIHLQNDLERIEFHLGEDDHLSLVDSIGIATQNFQSNVKKTTRLER